MDRYSNIADHGLIGDLQTAALVTTDGTLDWFCTPRFDSPSVFASLLDADRGGYYKIAPDRDDYVSRQLYLPDTAILVTRFMTPDGVGEVHDFMPVTGEAATDRHRLVRQIRVVRGVMRFAIEVQPRFDYGRASHKLELTEEGAVFESGSLELTLHPIALPGLSIKDAGVSVERIGDGLRWTRTLRAGETGGVVLESMGGTPRRVTPEEAQRLADETARIWRDWLHRSTYTGRWREMVARSAMTLKLMTYAPTGAPVAAPTAGLPEQAGGERNWDYRYTWIRDGSFSVYALLGLGYIEEAAAFGAWLRDRTQEQADNASGPLKIMYRVDGTSDLVEETLEHFEGWRGSRPVRIGNGAADQLQLDIYGEAMDSIFLADSHGLQPAHQGWTALADIIDWLCEHWDQPDEGIWETRGGRKNFTYGRFQAWVALDRAIRLAQRRGRPANVTRWTDVRDQVYRQVMERGWNPKVGAFTQHYDTEVLDSSLLMMPLQGFVAPRDPMWLSTLSAMDRELVSDSLVYRYNPAASPDGLAGNEGTFSLCTFWYVDALARAGRLEEARLVFEKMHTYANHLGLYSEEIGSTGEQLGNFPQAFSHLSLISAAVNLDYQLDRGAGLSERVGARLEQALTAEPAPDVRRDSRAGPNRPLEHDTWLSERLGPRPGQGLPTEPALDVGGDRSAGPEMTGPAEAAGLPAVEEEGSATEGSLEVRKPEQPRSGSRAAPRLFWNTRFPGNEAILSPPHGKLPTVIVGFEYLLETALEQTPAPGVSQEIAEPAGLIGTEVRFRLLGTGAGFALSSGEEYATRVESQLLHCEPAGTPIFQIRCRFDQPGRAQIKLRLLAENSRFLDQAIDFRVLGDAPDGTEAAGPDDDLTASGEAASSASAGAMDVSGISRPRRVTLHFEVTGGKKLKLECHATGAHGFDQPPVEAESSRDAINPVVEQRRGALVKLAERYPALAKEPAGEAEVPLPWELGAYKDEVLKQFAEIGWRLHEALFGFPGRSTDLAKLARSISMVGRDPGEVAITQIDDDIGLPLPWGLLYDAGAYGEALRKQGKDVPDRYTHLPRSADQVDVTCFWGQRFAMYRTRFPRDPLGPEHANQSGGAHVTAVLNPTFGSSIVGKQWAALTGEPLGAESLRLLEEARISDKQTLLKWVDDGASSHCDLLYFFCHASMPTRVGSGGYPMAVADPWEGALIGLGDEHDRSASVSLQDLRNWRRRRPRRPLVFLNACGSGQADPLYGNPFVEHFVRDWECRALVGTDWTVPTAFADVFSRKVVAKLRRGEALIDALRSVSMEALAHGNPYPLIYGLYGEPDVRFY